MRNEFEEKFNNKKKLIRRFFIGISTFIILAICVQIGAVYYGVTKIQESGGVHNVAVSILKEINSIAKEAEVK